MLAGFSAMHSPEGKRTAQRPFSLSKSPVVPDCPLSSGLACTPAMRTRMPGDGASTTVETGAGVGGADDFERERIQHDLIMYVVCYKILRATT